MKTFRQNTGFGHFDTTIAHWGVFHAPTVNKSLAMSAYYYVKLYN